ncbi:MAG: hypothetical protein ACK47B_12505 [Armatimonadota bacterium]
MSATDPAPLTESLSTTIEHYRQRYETDPEGETRRIRQVVANFEAVLSRVKRVDGLAGLAGEAAALQILQRVGQRIQAPSPDGTGAAEPEESPNEGSPLARVCGLLITGQGLFEASEAETPLWKRSVILSVTILNAFTTLKRELPEEELTAIFGTSEVGEALIAVAFGRTLLAKPAAGSA